MDRATRVVAISLWALSGVILTGTVSRAIADRMHHATVVQCERQAWPAHTHRLNVEFCRDYMMR